MRALGGAEPLYAQPGTPSQLGTSYNVGQKINSPWFPTYTGTITQGFGSLENIPSLGLSGPHDGIDIAMPVGTPLVVPAGRQATVTEAGTDPYGNVFATLTMDNGDVITLLHLNDLSVKMGQALSGGQVIGHSGNTGLSTGPHLDFTFFPQGHLGAPGDPWNWLTDNVASSMGSGSTGLLGFPDISAITGFFSHLSNPGHDPCSPPSDEAGLFRVIDAVSCPQNWWKVLFTGGGVVLIILGVVLYFFKEEKQVVIKAIAAGSVLPA